jgi:hypothetical protein
MGRLRGGRSAGTLSSEHLACCLPQPAHRCFLCGVGLTDIRLHLVLWKAPSLQQPQRGGQGESVNWQELVCVWLGGGGQEIKRGHRGLTLTPKIKTNNLKKQTKKRTKMPSSTCQGHWPARGPGCRSLWASHTIFVVEGTGSGKVGDRQQDGGETGKGRKTQTAREGDLPSLGHRLEGRDEKLGL